MAILDRALLNSKIQKGTFSESAFADFASFTIVTYICYEFSKIFFGCLKKMFTNHFTNNGNIYLAIISLRKRLLNKYIQFIVVELSKKIIFEQMRFPGVNLTFFHDY